MLLRRLENAAVALMALIVPLLAACAGMALLAKPQTPQQNATPNPQPAPDEMLRPADWLVFIDPWFAGTLTYWLAFFIATAALFVVAVFCGWPTGAPARPRRRCLLTVIAFVLGTAFAGPWLYVLFAC